MTPTITCLIKAPGRDPATINIANTLKALQEAVGGNIEVLPLKHGIVLICNEEGKLEGLTPNLWLRPYDIVCGTVLLCRTAGEDFASLSPADMRTCTTALRGWSV